MIEATFRATHITIPPDTPRFNGSAENLHGRIQDGFYDLLEELLTLSTLLNKAYTYMLYFNLERVNLDLKRSPFQMVREGNHIQDPQFMDFPPVVLDYLPLEGPELLAVNDVSNDLTISAVHSRITQFSKERKGSAGETGSGSVTFEPAALICPDLRAAQSATWRMTAPREVVIGMTVAFLILSCSLLIRWRVSLVSGTSRVTESDYLSNVSRSVKATSTPLQCPTGVPCRGIESSC